MSKYIDPRAYDFNSEYQGLSATHQVALGMLTNLSELHLTEA